MENASINPSVCSLSLVAPQQGDASRQEQNCELCGDAWSKEQLLSDALGSRELPSSPRQHNLHVEKSIAVTGLPPGALHPVPEPSA